MITLSMPLRGEEGAHRAILLALLTLIGGSSLIGCRHPVVQPLARHSVRIPALLTLHPAWSQIEALDGMLANTRTLPPPSVLVPASLPVPFAPPNGLPPNLVMSQEKIVRDDAARTIALLESDLDLRQRESVNSKQKAEEQIAITTYNIALEQKEIELRDANRAEAAKVKREVRRLSYRLQALDSQIRVYSASGLNARRLIEDAKLQQTSVTEQIDGKNIEIAGLLQADFHGLAEAALQGLRKQLDAATDAAVKKYSLEQSARNQQELDQAREHLNSLPTVIPKLTDHSHELNSPRSIPLVLAVTPIAAQEAMDNRRDNSLAQTNIAAAKTHRNAQLTAERATLLALIQADTRKAVEQVARRQGWRLAPEGQAEDWTERVRPILRAQWSPGAER